MQTFPTLLQFMNNELAGNTTVSYFQNVQFLFQNYK